MMVKSKIKNENKSYHNKTKQKNLKKTKIH